MARKHMILFVAIGFLLLLVGMIFLSSRYLFLAALVLIAIYVLSFALIGVMSRYKRSPLLTSLFGVEITVFGGFLMCSDKTNEVWVIGLAGMIFGLVISILSFTMKENANKE